ncbi:MAG: 2-oxo acid dehydrogenase subunit E2 [Christensenellales bacterium]|jgi:hypothetical protein
MATAKRRFKDRRDGKYLYDLDSYHKFLPYLLPRRCDAEAFLREEIDMSAVFAYLEEKNRDSEMKTTLFQVFVASIVRVVAQRPYLNRFISGKRFYQRDKIEIAFVAKKAFHDDGEEGLVRIAFDGDVTMQQVTQHMHREIYEVRGERKDAANDEIDKLVHLPRFLIRGIMRVFRFLSFHGWMPQSIIRGDPNHATVFLSNMGSIGAGAPYHHLNEWGTNSIFMCVGEVRKKPVVDADGQIIVGDIAEIAFTLDERIADGYYFSKSIQLLKEYLQNPWLLDRKEGGENED